MKIKGDTLSMLVALAAVVLVFGLVALDGSMDGSVEPVAEDDGALTSEEESLISSSDSVMRVLLVDNQADSLVLRTSCLDLSDAALQSAVLDSLCARMIATVQAPQYDGVGLAGPQVGISRRVIAVCRLDKENAPFEVYANVRIDTLYGGLVKGQEGCLSIPGYRGMVERYDSLIVSYTDRTTLERCRDTVAGYTARIFQHECDHLDGILYTDRTGEVYPEGNQAY